MKILFLCPSLEPGRDGVGDYTRRLGEELERKGHRCLCVAVNDSYLNYQQGGLIAECHEQDIVRFPSCQPWNQRFNSLAALSQEFDPEWISLQYVPHGFQAKGLPFAFARRIGSLGLNRSSHVMFHELWGGSRNRIRDRMIYGLQMWLLAHIMRRLRPRVVNVTNETYRQRLGSIGIKSEVLPLFGSIPLAPQDVPRNGADRKWVFAIFGSLRKGWQFEQLLAGIEIAREASGIEECRFLSVGRLGDYGQSLWEAMQRSGYKHFGFDRLGELEPHDVSRALHSADFGIAVSPLELINKSSAVAAMREHGLPVIVTRFRQETARSLVAGRQDFILLDDRFQENLRTAKRLPCQETLPLVAQTFVEALKAAE